MNVVKLIRDGDVGALQINERVILQNVENVMRTHSDRHEDYMTYWIASHRDHAVANKMYKVFTNTCVDAFGPKKYKEIMNIHARATIHGAVTSENIDILDLVTNCNTTWNKDDWSKSIREWYD